MLFIPLFLVWQNLIAQSLPKVTPPSPEASSLAKFSLIPISHHTGVPNIGIPIYTIQQDGISIPISLGYHARGMQVGEVAPRVGMGWALSYGGSLSRQVRGFADEAQHGYNSVKSTIKSSMAYDGSSNTSGGMIRRNLLSSMTSNNKDLIPDKYIFNANGASGTFFFNYDDNGIVIQQYQDTKIEVIIGGFKVTDSQGNVFYYGISKDGLREAKNKEYTMISAVYKGLNGGGYNQYGGPIEGPFPNSWQLMEIETVNGTTISFHYDKIESVFWRRSMDRYNPSNDPPPPGANHGSNGWEFNGASLNIQGPFLESNFSKIRTEEYQLKEIVFKEGKLKFLGGPSQRQDVGSYGSISSMPLEKIELRTNNNVLIKQFQLAFEYKQAISDGNYLPYLAQIDPTASKRLFLTSVTEKDGLGNAKPPYLFDYNSQQIPNRFSNSQDAWGYYNGMPNGHYLTFVDYNSSSNNRTVDTLKANVGILEKITYPTGGSVNFTYEHNKGIPPNAMKDVVSVAINPLTSRNEGLSHLDYSTNYNLTTKTYEKQFTINHIFYGGTGGVTANVNIQSPVGDCSSNAPNQSTCNFSITLEGGTYTQQLYNGSNSINRSLLPPGVYTLKVKPQNHRHNPLNWDHAFMVTLDWIEQQSDESSILYGGGKRIKRIENRDSNGSLTSFKEYEYRMPSGVSSGSIFGLPNYMSIKESDIGGVTVLSPTGATPGMPLTSLQSNTVGYSYVTEYYGDASNNIGKTEYEFTNYEDSGEFFKYPQTIPTDNSWLRGRNLKTKVYGKDENDNFVLEKEVENEYLYADLIAPFDFFKTAYVSHIDFNIDLFYKYFKDRRKYQIPYFVFKEDQPYGQDPEYKIYYLTGGTQDIYKTTERSFDPSGTLQNETTYSYNYNYHYQRSKTKTIDSKGSVFWNQLTYAQDNPFTTFGSIEDKIKQSNRLLVLESKSFKDVNLNGVEDSGERINHTFNQYKDWGGKKYLPEIIKAAKGSQSLEDRIVYHSYDSFGNPQEVSQKNGPKDFYIWGYNGTKPIAKIENTSYSQVLSAISSVGDSRFDTLEEIQTISDNDNDRSMGESNLGEGLLRKALNTLRSTSALSNSRVTIFTYDPLIGLTSITDPRGRVLYYEYDTFGRLKYVRDHDGNIVNENRYNYKN